MFIKSHGIFYKLQKSDILYLESTGDYVQYCTKLEKYAVLTTLKNMEEKIDPSFFIKVHRSFLVNFHHISNYKDNMVYIGNTGIPVSKTFKSQLLHKMNSLV